MLFLCTSLTIGGFRYRKKGGMVDLPFSVPWHRLWMRNTVVTVNRCRNTDVTVAKNHFEIISVIFFGSGQCHSSSISLLAFHCHSSRKFCIRLASIAVANSDLFCIFAPPYSMTCIRLWFLNFQMWQTYVNNLFIPYRMPLVGSKSVQKRAGNTWSKSTWNSCFLPPNTPLYEFLKFLFFRNVDHVEAKRMPFEF